MSETSADGHTARALDALLAEYNFVSSLIPFYRDIEMRALSALGLSVGAITTVFVALAEQQGAQIAVLSGILSFTTWLFVLFVTIEVTASLRIKRASSYISRYLYPKIVEVAPLANLAWETTRSLDLIGVERKGSYNGARNYLRRTLVTSGPLSLGIGVAGSVVGAVAIVVLLVSDRSSINPLFVWLYAAVAAVGGGLALCLGIYGFRLTREVEREN